MKRVCPWLIVFALLAIAVLSVVAHLQPSAHGEQRGDAIIGMSAQLVALVSLAGCVIWEATRPERPNHNDLV